VGGKTHKEKGIFLRAEGEECSSRWDHVQVLVPQKGEGREDLDQILEGEKGGGLG